MAADKQCILINGGKRIKLSEDTNPGNEGIKMSKNADGSWDVTIKTRISKDEAAKVIFKFSDLDPQGQPFEDVFPNMVYFTAMDVNEKALDVKLAPESEIFPSYDRDLGGSIVLKLNIENFGKTENAKTENVNVGNG